VCTALNTAIAYHVQSIAHRVNNLGQLIKGGATAIKLPAAVIRYHNGICSDIGRPASIFDRHNALETKRSAPAFFDLGRCIPIHGLIQHRRKVV
jgi:hypothetical protein